MLSIAAHMFLMTCSYQTKKNTFYTLNNNFSLFTVSLPTYSSLIVLYINFKYQIKDINFMRAQRPHGTSKLLRDQEDSQQHHTISW